MVTAVSPRAVFDVVFVQWESVRLIRGVADLYGSRPGAFGLFRLTKAVVSHLAVTGSIAVGDTLLQQISVRRRCPVVRKARRGGGERTHDSAHRALRHRRLPTLPFLAAERPQLKDLTGDLVKLREPGRLSRP